MKSLAEVSISRSLQNVNVTNVFVMTTVVAEILVFVLKEILAELKVAPVPNEEFKKIRAAKGGPDHSVSDSFSSSTNFLNFHSKNLAIGYWNANDPDIKNTHHQGLSNRHSKPEIIKQSIEGIKEINKVHISPPIPTTQIIFLGRHAFFTCVLDSIHLIGRLIQHSGQFSQVV